MGLSCVHNVSCRRLKKMRYVAAALLIALGGGDINAKNIKSILSSVGIDAEDDRVKTVVEQLKGKNVEELMAEGMGKLASVPSGGAAPAAGGAAAGGDAPAGDKKEEKKEESEEEEDDDMGFGLFD